MKTHLIGFALLLLTSSLSFAGGIYKRSAQMDHETAYKKVYAALEEERFWVIQEINMSDNLASFKDKWDDYNLNKIENIGIMIICNGWYANKVSNADPDMLALCPMRVTVIHKAGTSTVLFAQPSTFAADSKALPILKEIDETITGAIKSALK